MWKTFLAVATIVVSLLSVPSIFSDAVYAQTTRGTYTTTAGVPLRAGPGTNHPVTTRTVPGFDKRAVPGFDNLIIAPLVDRRLAFDPSLSLRIKTLALIRSRILEKSRRRLPVIPMVRSVTIVVSLSELPHLQLAHADSIRAYNERACLYEA